MAKTEFVRGGINDEAREKIFELLGLSFKDEYDLGWHRSAPITAEALNEIIDKIDDIIKES